MLDLMISWYGCKLCMQWCMAKWPTKTILRTHWRSCCNPFHLAIYGSFATSAHTENLRCSKTSLYLQLKLRRLATLLISLFVQKSNCSKFGVIYGRDGQDETQMYNNGSYLSAAWCCWKRLTMSLEHGSEGFEEFLSTLGERINMKGWDKYRGDFSNKGAVIFSFLYSRSSSYHRTGNNLLTQYYPLTLTFPCSATTADQKSVYTQFGDHEIMYQFNMCCLVGCFIANAQCSIGSMWWHTSCIWKTQTSTGNRHISFSFWTHSCCELMWSWFCYFQWERKRFIGNDIVVIVYYEGKVRS